MQGAGGSQRRNPWAASEEGKVQPNSWEHEKATVLAPVPLDCQVPLSKVSETAICHFFLFTKDQGQMHKGGVVPEMALFLSSIPPLLTPLLGLMYLFPRPHLCHPGASTVGLSI